MIKFKSKGRSILKFMYALTFAKPSMKVGYLANLQQYFRRSRYPLLPQLISNRLQRYGVYISRHAVIGNSLSLPHPTSIVIGEGVKIGDRVKIYQNVTLGGRVRGDWRLGNYPDIGDDSVIFAGAVIVGKVRVGRNCTIGANSVVITDLPDNSVAVGAPARVVRLNKIKTKEEYP